AGGIAMRVLLGKGDGTFGAAQNYDIGHATGSLAVGDFNGDRHLDLAVACPRADTVSILLGKGDGTFQAVQSFAAGFQPASMAVGDFDGDGHLDLAVADSGVDYNSPDDIPGSSNVSVLLSNDDGSFRDAQHYDAGDYPVSVAVGDFDG